MPLIVRDIFEVNFGERVSKEIVNESFSMSLIIHQVSSTKTLLSDLLFLCIPPSALFHIADGI